MTHTISNKQLIFNPANFILNHNMAGPFLTPIQNQEKMSLVLDLDETLVHFFYVIKLI
jgi:predicted HAD superfamily phosphohydrolase YqeG